MRTRNNTLSVLLVLLAGVGSCEPASNDVARSAQAVGGSDLLVTRMGEHFYQIQTGALRYIIRARNVGSSDGRYEGVGQYRLTSLYWQHGGREYLLLECGQCDGLEALSVDGVSAAWAGGGHGMESDPMGVISLGNGIALDLEVGETVGLFSFELRSSTTLFALEPGDSLYAPMHPRRPVSTQTLHYNITADGYEFQAETLALAAHFRHLRYTEMVQGPETSRSDGIFDGWRVYDDHNLLAWDTEWNDCVAGNAVVAPGNGASLMSSVFDMALSVFSDLRLPWYISHRADSCQIKLYQRDSSFQSIVPGEHQTYSHSMRFSSLPLP